MEGNHMSKGNTKKFSAQLLRAVAGGAKKEYVPGNGYVPENDPKYFTQDKGGFGASGPAVEDYKKSHPAQAAKDSAPGAMPKQQQRTAPHQQMAARTAPSYKGR
jgi:hypothetical protein